MFSETTATNKIKRLNKRIRLVAGGTSASKTISILLYLIAKAQSDTTPTLTSIVSESFPHLKRGAMRDFLNIMQSHNYYKEDLWNRTDCIYTFETGSRIEFFSADAPSKVRGPRRERLFVNEANNVAKESWDQLLLRTKEFALADWNPTSDFYLYDDYGLSDDGIPGTTDTYAQFLILTYLDNQALDPSIVQEIEKRRPNKGWWKVYGEGKRGEVEGKIYKDWQIIPEVPHEARLERYGLDFGYSNDPTAIVALYSYNGGYIIDEILHRKGMSNKQIADHLNNLPFALVIADSAEPKSIAEIAEYGTSIIPAQKGPGSVAQGIQYVQSQRISMTQNSTNTIKAYRNYLWELDKEGKILNVPNHFLSDQMDATRYALETMRPREEEEDYVAPPINSLIY